MPQYSRVERLAITASLVSAGLLGVFLLGMWFGSSGNPPAPVPAVVVSPAPPAAPPEAPAGVNPANPIALAPANTTPNAVNRDSQRHLDAAESLIAQALVNFQGAADTPGGPADKAISQVKLIAQDIADAQAYIQAHPDITPQSNTRTVMGVTTALNNQTVALRPGLDNLSAALVEIQKVPHPLGGARDRAVADITQTSTLIAAAVRGTVGQPPVVINPPIQLTPEQLKAALVPTPTPARFQPLRFAPSAVGAADFALTTIRGTQVAGLPDLASTTLADISPPLRNFSLSPAQLANDRGFENAVEQGLSYFVDSNGVAVAREIIRLNPATNKPQSASRTYLPATAAPAVKYLADVEPALVHLATLEQIKNGSYEPRLLTIAAPLTVQALWLTSDKGGPDLVFVLSSGSVDLTTQKLYPADEFMKSIRAARPGNPGAPQIPMAATDTPARFQPLHFSPAPANGNDLFLNTAKRNNANTIPELADATIADILPPLREFSLTPGQILAGRSLADGSTQIDFCYLLDHAGKTIERGNLAPNPQGTGQTLTVGNASAPNFQYLLEIEPALLHLVTLDQIKTGSYEPRLITAASPPFQVLWLGSDKGAPDLIYTLNTDTLALPNHKLLAADEFLKVLQPALKNPPAAGQPSPEVLKAALAPTAVPPSLESLRFVPSPIGGAAAALAAAQRLSNTVLPDIGGATLADFNAPIRMYSVDTADIANDKGLESAHENAFAYFLDSGGKTVVRVDVHVNAAGKPTPMTLGIASTLQYIAQVNPALAHLATLSQIKTNSYEPRLLIAPNFQAIWLTSDKTAPTPPDLIYTISAASPDLPAKKLSTAESFLKTLRPYLKQQQHPAAPGG